MAVRIGEELLLSAYVTASFHASLYADVDSYRFVDVHYYFSPPQAKPLHHRFDKGSYFYVFRNSGTGQIRAEIANNAGTPDQDAVSGCRPSVSQIGLSTRPLIQRPTRRFEADRFRSLRQTSGSGHYQCWR